MQEPSTGLIDAAARLLRAGGLVAFPTETVYGLGANAADPVAVRRIFEAKGRPADHPLIVHLHDPGTLDFWARDIPEKAFRLAESFWPGPLTLILKRRHAPLAVTGGQDTVGLRVPGHPVALMLLKAFGGGVAAPSANRFGRVSPTRARHVREELKDKVDLILDGGPCQVGVESTIVDLSGPQPILLRPGHITRQQLEDVLQTELIILQHPEQSTLRAPGLMAVHYAPVTKAMLCAGEDLPDIVQSLTAQGQKIGLLGYQQAIRAHLQLHSIRLPQQAEAYAQALYAALRELDRLQLDLILVEQPPETEAWRAINDRLNKATVPFQSN